VAIDSFCRPLILNQKFPLFGFGPTVIFFATAFVTSGAMLPEARTMGAGVLLSLSVSVPSEVIAVFSTQLATTSLLEKAWFAQFTPLLVV
jgi:hypothetical protein